MKTALILATAFATLIGVLVKTVLGAMVQEEAATRLSRLPIVLVRLAAARLPHGLRADLASEWQAELHHVLYGTEGIPLTRLMRGIQFSAGLLLSAPAVADGHTGRTTRLSRWVRVIGAAGTVASTVWPVAEAWAYLHPIAPLYQVLIYSSAPPPQPTPDQLTLTGVSYLCIAAALLGTAAILATGRWQISNLSILCFVSAGVLSYLGGGPLYWVVAAGIVFAVLAAAVPLQFRSWRRSHDAAISARPV
jgi:hypothetical protein